MPGRGQVERPKQKLTLQDFEVLNVQILRVDIELDLGHGHIHVDAVEDLAEGSTGLVLGSLLCLLGGVGGLGHHGHDGARRGRGGGSRLTRYRIARPL